MKSLVSNHNHNTSGHSLRKFRNTKYFQDQRGYETDYMKRKNEFAGSTPQQKKGKNKFDDQVNEYLKKAGSGLSESVVAADDSKNLDYASEVESKIKSLEAKHLASSVIFQKLSHCHSELMNLHNTKIPSNNNTFDKANITTRSIDVGTRPTTQRQFKSQSNLTIISTPYKSPSFQNKKSNQSNLNKSLLLFIHSKHAFFNQANNGETISKILESSLDRLDEEDIAENISIKEKILDSLNESHHQHHEFNNAHMNGIDEQEEYQRLCARNLQSEINNQGNLIRNKLDQSYDNEMQNVNESDAYSINQKLILLGSNIKPKTPLKHDSSYFLSPNIRSSAEKAKKQEGHNKIYVNGQQSQNQNQHQKLNYLSPDSSQKKQAPLLSKNSKNDKFKAQQLTGQINGQQIQPPPAQQSQRQVRQKTPEKNIPQTSRGATSQNNVDTNCESAQKQQRSPSQQKNGQQSSSKKKVEKYYLQQVERQNDLVQQQQKQIIQYQQQLQQQTLEFQLFMQEQQLLSQQNYFQQQQQLMNQQRSSASMLLQQPFLPLSLLGASANPLFSFNHLNSPLVMSAANPTQSAAFIPQVHPPIIINNNIQKSNEEEQNNQNNINATNANNLNGSINSQQQQTVYQTSNKTHSLQIPFYEKNGDETLTPVGQQGTADQSQIERQTEQIFKNNNNSNSFAGNFAKKSSSQRRKWDIGQKTCTQSELSADEDYLTQYNREVRQPRQFEPGHQLYLPPQQNMHQNQPNFVQYKKPVKFDIFWEKDELEQENKENQRNNSNKRVNNSSGAEENKLESLIQKQIKNVTEHPENQTNSQNNNRSLYDIFVSKKTDLQRKLEYEKNAQHQVLSYRNQSPDLSKEDLIQIRRDLLKPKSQQVMQSINFDSHNQSHQQSHFQSQLSHISQGFPTNSLTSQSQVNPSISTAQTTHRPQIQTSTISLTQPTTNLNVVPLATPNTTSSQINNLGAISKQSITHQQQINTQLNTQSLVGSQQKPYIQTQPLNNQQQINNLNTTPQQQAQQPQLNFQSAPSSKNQYTTSTQQQNLLYSQQPSGGIQLVQQQQQQMLPQQNTMIQINPQNPIQIQSQFQQPFIPLHQPYQLNQNPPVNQIQQYHRITSN
ncbi:hypothetical protein ABPG72_018143 [Tetrahymena utriculariae]